MKREKTKKSQTEIAEEVFAGLNSPVSLNLIYSIVKVKKATALANLKAGKLDKAKSNAIVSACKEILVGKYDDEFKTSSLQGGAGTLINTNVNEVIAKIAAEKYNERVHTNDHVNLSQSTNDVNPSALRITCLNLTRTLLDSIDNLLNEIEKKAKEYKNVKKLGRTHMQDAVATTFGEIFLSWHHTITNDKKRIIQAREYLYFLNLGGTAIGNGVNSNADYVKEVYEQLKKETGLNLTPAKNLMSLTSSSTDFCNLTSSINILFCDLSKIAHDIRFLASGPRGGIGELVLPEFLDGSTIMPGKVNPIIPESVNQTYYFISGKSYTIHMASENSDQELSIMFPVISDSVISILKVSARSIQIFSDKCIKVLSVNLSKSKYNLDRSFAHAAKLTPKLGYDMVKKLVHDAIESDKSLEEIILSKKIMSKKDFHDAIGKN